MQIRHQYLQRYLHEIALNQLTDDYQSKGYSVVKEERIGDVVADLVARKSDEVIVVEVKVEPMTSKKREQIIKLSDYVNSHKNHKFFVVFATPPKPKKIKIPNLDQLLLNYLSVHMPESLKEILTTRIEAVDDSTVDELVVQADSGFQVKGSGAVEVEFQDKSGGDDHLTYDTFSFTFEAILKQGSGSELVIDQMVGLTVDTSSFNE